MEAKELLNSFSSFYEKYKDKELVFCGHRHADLDSLISSYVLSKQFPKAILAISDDMNTSCKKIADKFGIEVKLLSDVRKDIPLVVLDTSHDALLPQAKGRKIIAVFDHHQQTEENFRGEFNFIDSNAKATAELIAILDEKFNFSSEDATLLAVAIVSDTMRFIDATKRTLKMFNRMYEKSSYDYRDIIGMAFPAKPLTDKIEIVDSLSKVGYDVYRGYVISTSTAGTREGEIATYLAQAGDLAFIAVDDKKLGGTRISARANMHANIPLNEVMNEVGKHFKGAGGGHVKAAGCIAYASVDEVLDYCVEVAKKYIDKVE